MTIINPASCGFASFLVTVQGHAERLSLPLHVHVLSLLRST